MQVEDKRVHRIGWLSAEGSAAAATSPTLAVLCDQERTRQAPLQVIVLCCSSEIASFPGSTYSTAFSHLAKNSFHATSDGSWDGGLERRLGVED